MENKAEILRGEAPLHNPLGKRWIIPDIHGCPLTLKALIEDQIQPGKGDQLFFLGDYLDKGPDSGAVLEYLFDLINEGFKIFPLRGNHEAMFLDSYDSYEPDFFKRSLRLMKCRGMLDEKEEVPQTYLDFLRNLPYYYELDHYLLVHAAFDFSKEDPFGDKVSMLWLRASQADPIQQKHKIIIHGHQPHYLQIIQEKVQNREWIIPLDNGCGMRKPRRKPGKEGQYRYDYSQLRRLCALEPDEGTLLVQENLDM